MIQGTIVLKVQHVPGLLTMIRVDVVPWVIIVLETLIRVSRLFVEIIGHRSINFN